MNEMNICQPNKTNIKKQTVPINDAIMFNEKIHDAIFLRGNKDIIEKITPIIYVVIGCILVNEIANIFL